MDGIVLDECGRESSSLIMGKKAEHVHTEAGRDLKILF